MARKSPTRRRLDHWVFYPIQSVLLYASYGLFGLLSVDAASALGGWVGRMVGPWLAAANRRARHNLALAMPERSEEERRRIVLGMWDNVGRTLGEYPHLARIRDSRIEVAGLENVTGPEVEGRSLIMIGAHTANWESTGPWLAKNIGRLNFIYRPPNNWSADRLIGRIRSALGIVQYRKGPEGTRAAMKALARGDNLGMFLDQKLNTGIAVPFFGHDAMTTPSLALFALRFDCTIVPTRLERTGGARFRLTFYRPLEVPRSDDRDADIMAIMTRVNEIFEGWIRERPEQWFWMHRRWVKSIP